jgi:hypothetical protein
MPGRSDGVPIRLLRAAVEARVAATSRRQVAAEVGLSPRGLLKFLEGARPHPATRDKLENWYADYRRQAGSEPTAAEALSVLLAGFPPGQRADAFQEARAFFHALYARNGLTPPDIL